MSALNLQVYRLNAELMATHTSISAHVSDLSLEHRMRNLHFSRFIR